MLDVPEATFANPHENGMKLYRVQSGTLDSIVHARDHMHAAEVAVREGSGWDEPPELGRILDIIEVAEDDMTYVLTEHACRAAGCWRDA